MNWFSDLLRPRVKAGGGQKARAVPEDLWKVCASCGRLLYHRERDRVLGVCPGCGHHNAIPSSLRFRYFFDEGQYTEHPLQKISDDPLHFSDRRSYEDRLAQYRERTGNKDAVSWATGTLEDVPLAIFVVDFAFMGGSMGRVFGITFLEAVTWALTNKGALLAVTASGGARMQEGMYSLIQMVRTTAGVARLQEAGLPYLVLLSNPTMGGVSASFAMLGDVHLAEPRAVIGFTGRRVIQQTVREELPDNFQTAEYLYDHGMLDMIVERKQQRKTVGTLLRLFMRPHA